MDKLQSYLFRCSSLGHLMTPLQGDSNLVKWQKAQARHSELIANVPNRYNKDGKTQSKLYDKWLEKCIEQNKIVSQLAIVKDDITLSDTAIVHISDIHTSLTTGRQTDIENKYISKGLQVEEDSITLYSRVKKKFYKKNDTRLKNLYITGEPDLFEGIAIHSATHIPDIKSSWDAFTFRRTFVKELNKMYKWQLAGYMDLSGATTASVAYCLVNTPQPLIESEKRKLWYKLGCPNEDDSLFIDACNEIQVAMTYDDIPLSQRVLEYHIERSEDDIEQIHKYVLAGRKYLIELDNKLQSIWQS